MSWSTKKKPSLSRLAALRDNLEKACNMAIQQNLDTIKQIKNVLEAKKKTIKIVRK